MSRRILIDMQDTVNVFPLDPESHFGLAITRCVTDAALDALLLAGWRVAVYFDTATTWASWSAWRPTGE